MPDYKPAGFQDVTPYLVVTGADRLLKFLKDAFGAEEISMHRREDNSIMHAELRIGDSIIEMGQANETGKTMPMCLHLYVPNTDSTYKEALAAGGESLTEPSDAPYGDRTAAIKDPSGNHWFLATLMFR